MTLFGERDVFRYLDPVNSLTSQNIFRMTKFYLKKRVRYKQQLIYVVNVHL